MSYKEIGARCKKLVNQNVEIRCRDGSTHRGVLCRVDDRFAYIRPYESRPEFNDGPGLFLWGWGPASFGGGEYAVALTSIVAILAIGLFW